MKRLFALLAALTLVTGFAAAQDDEGIGLSAGLEFNIYDVNNEPLPELTALLIYENSFLDGDLDLYAELDYYIGFKKENDKLPMGLYFDFCIGYNLGIGSSSTLSFILENENDSFQFTPWFDASTNISGVLKPGIRFTQEITSVGELYAQVDLPLWYTADPFGVGIDVIVGWDSTFGLGIKLKEHNTIRPGAGYDGLDIIVSYENGPIYAEVEVDTYSDMGEDGVSIIPEFDYSFKAFTFYVKCTFDGVGSDPGVSISPGLGIKYSF